MKNKLKNISLLLGAVVICFAPLYVYKEANFQGTDSQATDVIKSINGSFVNKPLLKPLFVPPSTEVETFLFCLQTAIGSSILGYFIGYFKGKKENSSK